MREPPSSQWIIHEITQIQSDILLAATSYRGIYSSVAGSGRPNHF